MKLHLQIVDVPKALPEPSWHTAVAPRDYAARSKFIDELIRVSDQRLVELKKAQRQWMDFHFGFAHRGCIESGLFPLSERNRRHDAAQEVDQLIRGEMVFRFEQAIDRKQQQAGARRKAVRE